MSAVKRLLLVLSLVPVLAGWACCEEDVPPEVLQALRSYMGAKMESWNVQADKVFPKPPVVIEYERVFEACDAGRIAEELPNIEKLATQPICLGSADAWAKDPQVYYEAYRAGRLLPARAVIRRVGYNSLQYSQTLREEGKGAEALRVMHSTLAIARQIVHIEPHDTCSLLSGLGLWKSAWLQLSKQLDAAGDKARARRAASCAHQSMVFLRTRISPVLAAGTRRCAAFERELKKVPKSKQEGYARRRELEFIRADAVEDDRLIKLWDTEVDTVAAKQLLKELQNLK